MHGTCDKLTPWADDGGSQVEAPTDVKIAHGWNIDEQPPNVHENWKNNRGDVKINELIDIHDLNCENDYNDTIASRCSGLPASDALLNPVNPVNREALTTYIPVSICRGYNYVTKKECIFGLDCLPSAAGTILGFANDEDGTIVKTRIITNIPTTSGLVPVDICCDGFFLYLLYSYDDGGNDQSRLYKVALGEEYANGVATTYTKTYEPAGHGAIPNKLAGTDGHGGKRLCVADATHLAFIDDRNQEIVVVTKALTSHLSGSGNLAVVAGLTSLTMENTGICSDGTRIWFYATGVATTVYWNVLCAALIDTPTDPTAGMTRDWSTAPVAWPRYELDVLDTGSFALVWDGTVVHALCNGGWGPTISNTHGSFDIQFDPLAEHLYLPRYMIPSGHIRAGNHNGGACFTGRHVAVVFPICPVTDLYVTNLWLKTNRYQAGLCLLEPNRGGVNIAYSIAWGVQTCTIHDEHITAVKVPTVPVDPSKVVEICFADDCVWVLQYFFDLGTESVESCLITRIPAISRR